MAVRKTRRRNAHGWTVYVIDLRKAILIEKKSFAKANPTYHAGRPRPIANPVSSFPLIPIAIGNPVRHCRQRLAVPCSQLPGTSNRVDRGSGVGA